MPFFLELMMQDKEESFEAANLSFCARKCCLLMQIQIKKTLSPCLSFSYYLRVFLSVLSASTLLNVEEACQNSSLFLSL